MTVLTIFFIKKFVDNKDNPQMRPETTFKKFKKVEKEQSINIQNYLIDPNDEGIDEEGNTSVHSLTKQANNNMLEQQISHQPQLMFMLNKQGLTPLDLCILQNDESKSKCLINKMKEHGEYSSLKMVKKPHRLELKFEKSYCLAIQKNNFEIIEQFPSKSIRTVYVSMSQLKDYKKFKEDKKSYQEIMSSPIHLACRTSNEEIVHNLVDYHSFDINMLLFEKNSLYELLSTAGYQDYKILTYLIKKRKPQINSGVRLPLNQAILRGNPFIIKQLLDLGKPNFFVKDINGKSPIHIAAAKLDLDTFDKLIKQGADPMLTDSSGNSILHLMCQGSIADIEYDFLKEIVERYDLRLTRNKDNKSPLNIIRSYGSKPSNLRGQPNYKKKIWEFFDEKIQSNPNFIDSDKNEDIHKFAIDGKYQEFILEIDKVDLKDGKSRSKMLQLINSRNNQGKNCLLLAIENKRQDIAAYLLDNFKDLNIELVDSFNGNTCLHLACQVEILEICQKIYNIRPQLCIKQNYLGQTPIHIATQQINLQILNLFSEFKSECLLIKDNNGENPLFIGARAGDKDIFKWFYGHNDYFKARGDQNYKGQTIEHIVCLSKKTEIVNVIKPRPDTKDYYGNLPLYYSLQENDFEMIKTYFKSGRDYFYLRNYKMDTIFHICARFNSLDALKCLINRTIFIEELLKKDYKGDTAMHVGAKQGNVEIMEFYMSRITKSFMQIENDFGLTPLEALKEKVMMVEEKVDVNADDTADIEKNDIKNIIQDIKKNKSDNKFNQLKECLQFIESFDNYVSEETWKDFFDIPLKVYLESQSDQNLKVFMGFGQISTNVNTQSALNKDQEEIKEKIQI